MLHVREKLCHNIFMTIFDGIILGMVQGVTEFLPISSSGHLILVREVLGLQTEFGLSFDAVLHFATAFAVLIYFRSDFLRLVKTAHALLLHKPAAAKEKMLLFALILGTLPAVIFGLLLEGYMETVFRSAELIAVTLLVGAGIFYFAEKVAQKKTNPKRSPSPDLYDISYKSGEDSSILTPRKGLWIGFFQALALIPGMSRAGMTISGGLFLGLHREEAARFGFLLSFPIILGAGFKKFFELGSNDMLVDIGITLFAGALTAFMVGILVVHYLLKYLKTHTLAIFIWYRVALAVIVLGFVWL